MRKLIFGLVLTITTSQVFALTCGNTTSASAASSCTPDYIASDYLTRAGDVARDTSGTVSYTDTTLIRVVSDGTFAAPSTVDATATATTTSTRTVSSSTAIAPIESTTTTTAVAEVQPSTITDTSTRTASEPISTATYPAATTTTTRTF